MKEMEKAFENAVGWKMENQRGFCKGVRLSIEAKIGSNLYNMIPYNGEPVEEIVCRLS